MLSNRPYLLRAFYEWIVDSHCTPIIVLDATNPRCKVPKDFIEDGEIIFNISSTAVRDFKISNEQVEFKASFSGVVHIISAPIKAILAIYAEENNEGIFFDSEDGEDEPAEMVQLKEGSDGNIATNTLTQEESDVPPKGKPFLRLV